MQSSPEVTGWLGVNILFSIRNIQLVSKESGPEGHNRQRYIKRVTFLLMEYLILQKGKQDIKCTTPGFYLQLLNHWCLLYNQSYLLTLLLLQKR